MLTRFKTPIETFRRNAGAKDAERRRTDHHRPSGRLGGPGVSVIRKDESVPLKIGMDSYSTAAPFENALKKVRKALSRSGFEILRECDIGSRIRRGSGNDGSPRCRILYVADPELLVTAISTHASAALWLPIPLVVCDRGESVALLVPAESIVRDRAALLGLRLLVQESYRALAAALRTVARCDETTDPDWG
jgi:uncharacterized protein (DUF302 family)